MAKIFVVLPDAEREIIDALTEFSIPGVSTDYPSVKLALNDGLRYQVDLESSNTDDFPVLERAQVRITVHGAHGRRTDVKAEAAAVLAYLAGWDGNANVACVTPLSGRSAVSVDPATGNVMCWVLVRVDLLASLAS